MVWKISMHEISLVALGSLALVCGFQGVQFLKSGVMNIIEWELETLNSCSIVYVVVLDWVSLLFMSFVFLISSSVLFYSGSYMSGDKTFNRFMWLVLGFVMSMSFMVLSPNLISILLGWDGLGLISYALVIYYQNEKSANAGMLTVLSNRVGDVAILLSIGLMSNLGSWNFLIYGEFMEDNNWLLIKCLMVLAAMTKSAQIPFSAWLPAAMAAPTPVSALVHSSTLVTAGVYLMIRFSGGVSNSSVSSWLLIISCLTMFMAGLGANFEYDLKKIIALSTLSQLGVMLSILSLGYTDLAFFHLLSHALFKALLFMCAGVVIHSVSDYQDIRFMGGLVNFMPLTVSYMTVANLSLCGFPFLAGFYSKDMILEVAFMSWINFVSLVLYIGATGLTVMYTLRLIFFTLSGDMNLMSVANVSDSDFTMTNSMSMLGMGAVVGGSGLSWLMFPEPYMVCLSDFMKGLTLLVSLVGGSLGYMVNKMNVNYKLKSLDNYKFVWMAGSMWFLPSLSTFSGSKVALSSGIVLQNTGDKGWYEYWGGEGINMFVSKLFNILNKMQLSSLKVFMKVFVFSMIMILYYSLM
uniref:NADH-ubiquinone oxidoreductase chain 5 n=1 Tax=Calappa bilineata TaxID=405176 RepID=A0A6G8IZN7_9EUCA|nr:NADH dehydrogenase subunit 5 [Calappa bilineata]QIM59230.1 NADH dehydrogenase subunit 5 [Calappa bilineata]